MLGFVFTRTVLDGDEGADEFEVTSISVRKTLTPLYGVDNCLSSLAFADKRKEFRAKQLGADGVSSCVECRECIQCRSILPD
jgi:hypothetical protein